MRFRDLLKFSLSFILAGACSHGYGDPSSAGPVAVPNGRIRFSAMASLVAGETATFSVDGCFWSGLPGGGSAAPGDGGSALPCAGSAIAGCCVGPTDPSLADLGCIEQNLDVGPVEFRLGGKVIAHLRFLPRGYALPPSGPPVRWSQGDRLEASGGGLNGFPSFDVTVEAAAPLILGNPPSLLGIPLAVDRTHDLALGWSPPGAAISEVWIASTDPATGNLMSVVCPFANDSGTARLSIVALAHLPAGGLGALDLFHANRATEGHIVAESRASQRIAVETP